MRAIGMTLAVVVVAGVCSCATRVERPDSADVSSPDTPRIDAPEPRVDATFDWPDGPVERRDAPVGADDREAFVDRLIDAACEASQRCISPTQSDARAMFGYLCHPDGFRRHPTVLGPGIDPNVLRAARECGQPFDAELASRCLERLGATCQTDPQIPWACRFALIRMPAGSSCRPGDCASGETCAPVGERGELSPWRCVPAGDVGDSCAHGACREGLDCVGGTCIDPRERCAPTSVEPGDDGCASDDAYCRTTEGATVCAPAARLGEACSAIACAGCPEDVLPPCASGLQCETDAVVSERPDRDGVCVPMRRIGDACHPGLACPPAAFCDEGRCAWRPTLGEACDEAAACVRGLCIDGTCGLPAAGEWCSEGGGYSFLADTFGLCPFPASCSGVCQSIAAWGEPCGAPGVVCAEGLVCDPFVDRCDDPGVCALIR